jgi:hypothetical protein
MAKKVTTISWKSSFNQRDLKSKCQIEKGPLLTVETEVNGDSKSANERGPSLVGLLGLSCRYKIFLFITWLL